MIIALVGMPGAGKSEAVKVFEHHNFTTVRFGEVTGEEIRRKKLLPGEATEKTVRENLRKTHGMAAFAILSFKKIKAVKGDLVIDGLRSYEEYEFLKQELGELKLIEIHAPPSLRWQRVSKRKVRPFTKEEMRERDQNELRNLNMEKTLESADVHILNDGTKKELEKKITFLIKELRGP